MATNNNTSKYDYITNKELIDEGSPKVYLLKPKEGEIGSLKRMTVGEKNPNKKNKTILLVGATGAGKSTLINALVNFTMGVEWEDDVCFQIVEDEKKEQSESQTSDVIVYEIFGFEDKTLPYSLTIIDTPGYGNTKGIEHDVIVSQRLFDLFRSKDGVHEIDVVGLVLKGGENQRSDRQSYIFNSVMSLFGKDLERNIVALMTHSPGTTPRNALKALEAANIKCARNEKNQPLYFLFNNCQNEARTDDIEDLEYEYKKATRGMKQFTAFLEKTASRKLEKTVNVLNERITLTACIQNLKERIQYIELKPTEIQQTQEALKKHEEVDTFLNKIGMANVWRHFIQEDNLLLESLQKEMEDLEANKTHWLDEAYEHVVKLELIALNAVSVSTYVHLDFLIEEMKKRKNTRKVKKLKEMASQKDKGCQEGVNYMARALINRK